MIDYVKLPRHDILCIDMKSFFATCECVKRGFDPLKKKLAVVGDKNQDGSVVLASTPELKKLGIQTGSRLYEIKELKDKSIFIAQARMGLYQEISNHTRQIFKEFVPDTHIDIYSIDEAWLTLDGTEQLWGTPWETAYQIKETIKNKIGMIATIGIGDNKFLAKAVLDNYGKHEGIAECRFEDVKTLLHPLPIEKMWGVGKQMKIRFEKMKIYTIGDLANTSIEVIQKNLGANGIKLHMYANGVDESPVVYKEGGTTPSFTGSGEQAKSVGRGVTLWQDYKVEEDILLVIHELLDDVCHVLRERSKGGKTLQLTVEYSKHESDKGFSRQKTTETPSNDADVFFLLAKELLSHYHKKNAPVRKIRVAIDNLSIIEVDNKKQHLLQIQDELNEKFGKGTIQKGSSLQEKSILKDKNKKIRGHYE